jgi:hypothetical protein
MTFENVWVQKYYVNYNNILRMWPFIEPKCCVHIHKCLAFDPILKQLNRVRPSTPYCLRSVLILYTLRHLKLFLRVRFCYWFSYTFIISHSYAAFIIPCYE